MSDNVGPEPLPSREPLRVCVKIGIRAFMWRRLPGPLEPERFRIPYSFKVHRHRPGPHRGAEGRLASFGIGEHPDLIDEYDNFANRLLAGGADEAYEALVTRTGFVRTFYATLKAGTATRCYFGFAENHWNARRIPSSVDTSGLQPRAFSLLLSKRLPFQLVAVL